MIITKGDNYVFFTSCDHLPGIYKPGAPGFPAGIRVAGHASGDGCSAVLVRRSLYDHRCRDDHIESLQ